MCFFFSQKIGTLKCEVQDTNVASSSDMSSSKAASTSPIKRMIHHETLPIIDENPGDASSIKRVYSQLSEWALEGTRKFYFAGSDAGAYDENELPPEAIHVMGTGHEVAIIVRCMNSIAWNYGGDLLAYCHGFVSEGSQNFMKNAMDNKKAKSFLLNVCRPAVVSAIVREWANTVNHSVASAASDGSKFKFDDLLDYLDDAIIPNTSDTDRTFESNVHFWVKHAIPSLALTVKGQNGSDFHAHSGGRKGCLPYLWCRRHHEYGRLIVRDTANFHVLCPKELLQLRINFFCCQGNGPFSCEGYDYKHEAVNKDISQEMSGPGSTRQFQWGAFATALGPQVSTDIYLFMVKKKRVIIMNQYFLIYTIIS